jgi:hypothetical protein
MIDKCPATTRDGKSCLLETGHAGIHVSLGGYFQEGGWEHPLRQAPRICSCGNLESRYGCALVCMAPSELKDPPRRDRRETDRE